VQIEVELKFAVPDLAAVESGLSGLGASVSEAKLEIDVYYQHPARDFAATDEALRIRRRGPLGFMTYKGPKLDATTKTRREIDLALPDDPASPDRYAELLDALGFKPRAEVRKWRRKANVAWEGRQVEASLDDVVGLGTFVELELLTSPEGIAAARQCLLSLAARLGLAGSERRSYLELLLERHP
jgi:adenylate cyclase, class 2